jgi:hypothetical protein
MHIYDPDDFHVRVDSPNSEATSMKSTCRRLQLAHVINTDMLYNETLVCKVNVTYQGFTTLLCYAIFTYKPSFGGRIHIEFCFSRLPLVYTDGKLEVAG